MVLSRRLKLEINLENSSLKKLKICRRSDGLDGISQRTATATVHHWAFRRQRTPA